MSTRLVVSKATGSKLIKDIPRISLDLDSYGSELDESEDQELESYSDPTYAPESASDDELSCVEVEPEASSRPVEASPASRVSHSEGTLAEEASVIDKPLELDYQWEDLSSTVPWVSHGDVVIEYRLIGSDSSSILEEDVVHPEIGEGFDRVRKLVDELLSVDKSCNEIEANAQFVQGLLRELSNHVTDNWGDVGNEELDEEVEDDKSILLDKKVLKKEVWVTKCDAKIANPEQVVVSQEETLCEVNDLNDDLPTLPKCPPVDPSTLLTMERFLMKTDICPTTISTASTLLSTDSPTSTTDSSVESQDCLSPTCSTFDAGSSNPVPPVQLDSPGEPEATESKVGQKSKYELIREDIIAERNAQLKAMGFFEEFAVLRSDMNPTKKQKMKKKQKKQDLLDNNRVRRSERIFLCSPEVDLSEVKNKATEAVVKDVIVDIIDAASKDENVQKMLTCANCGKRFKKREYLQKHAKLVHNRLLTIACQHCDFTTNRIKVLKKHLVNQHSDNTVLVDQMSRNGGSSNPISNDYCCDKYDFRTKLSVILTKDTIQTHGLAKSELEVLGCDQCSYVTTKRRNLRSHKLKVHEKGDQPYRCNRCNYVTPYKSYFLRHQTIYHNVEKKFEGESKEGTDVKVHGCNQCNFIAKHRRMLWSHKTKHHAKATPKPEILTASSNSYGPHFMDFDISTGAVVDSDLESVEIFTEDSDKELDDEVVERSEGTINGGKIAESDNKWPCDICGKVVFSRSNLKRHTRTVHQISKKK